MTGRSQTPRMSDEVTDALVKTVWQVWFLLMAAQVWTLVALR